jgi:hypothetical protein
MTTPDESFHAIRKTRDFMYDLLDPRKTPRVPKAVRDRASGCLRHYPMACEAWVRWGERKAGEQ